MDTSYLQKLHTLLESAPPEIRQLVLGDEIDKNILSLTEKYKLNVGESVALKNTILLTLLGVMPTSDIKDDLKKNISIDEADLVSLLKDVDSGIFEKARMQIFGEKHEKEMGKEVRNIPLSEEGSRDILRDQILAKTNHDSAIDASPLDKMPPPPKGKKDDSPVLPGSRSELLEKLNVLDQIPTTEEVEERLANIRSQITKINAEAEILPKEEPVLEEVISETPKEKEKVVYPTRYNIDPYREIPT